MMQTALAHGHRPFCPTSTSQHAAACRRLICGRPSQATRPAAAASTEASSSAGAGSWQSALPALGTLACSLLLAGSAYAAPAPPDSAAVGKCLLSNCQGALAGCLADGGCLQNLVCLTACNDAPDVTACQIRCGDLYADKAIDVFNSCAVSAKK
jgi:violaxanthin de-epoxidase